MAACEQIRVNSYGVDIIITITEDGSVVNVSSATTKEILIRKPSGTLLTNTASLYTDGTDGKIRYISVSGDFDEEGLHRIQGVVDIGSGHYPSEVKTFQVYGNI